MIVKEQASFIHSARSAATRRQPSVLDPTIFGSSLAKPSFANPSPTALNALPPSFQPLTAAGLLAGRAATAAAGPMAPLTQIMQNPVEIATSMMTVKTSPSVAQLIMAFTLGGIFFSSAIAFVAFGLDRIKSVTSGIVKIFRQIWTSIVIGLVATRMKFTSGGKWRFRDAWKELRYRMKTTRKVAEKGLRAMKLESTLYAASLGPPGLAPLQHIIDRLLNFSLHYQLEKALKEGLAQAQGEKTKSISLVDLDLGTVPPKLEAARIFDLGSDAIAFDCKFKWKADDFLVKLDIAAVKGLARIPVNVRNLKVDGTVRVILAPLCKTPPGFGAMLVSFPTLPRIGIDISIAGGELTKVPWLKSELQNILQRGLAENLLWPKRTVIPIAQPPEIEVPILSKATLKGLETTDPLLEAEQALEELRPFLQQTMSKKKISPRTINKLLNVAITDPDAGNSTKAEMTYKPGARTQRVRNRINKFARKVYTSKDGDKIDFSTLDSRQREGVMNEIRGINTLNERINARQDYLLRKEREEEEREKAELEAELNGEGNATEANATNVGSIQNGVLWQTLSSKFR
jgi:hypothetical protein